MPLMRTHDLLPLPCRSPASTLLLSAQDCPSVKAALQEVVQGFVGACPMDESGGADSEAEGEEAEEEEAAGAITSRTRASARSSTKAASRATDAAVLAAARSAAQTKRTGKLPSSVTLAHLIAWYRQRMERGAAHGRAAPTLLLVIRDMEGLDQEVLDFLLRSWADASVRGVH